jgi:hypothetical protein
MVLLDIRKEKVHIRKKIKRDPTLLSVRSLFFYLSNIRNPVLGVSL